MARLEVSASEISASLVNGYLSSPGCMLPCFWPHQLIMGTPCDLQVERKHHAMIEDLPDVADAFQSARPNETLSMFSLFEPFGAVLQELVQVLVLVLVVQLIDLNTLSGNIPLGR